MLFPYSTDAPIYHYPLTTVGLVVINVLAFAWELTVDDEVLIGVLLQYGNGLNPIQWVTHLFLHAGFMHLIGNMLFLWTFGLIVEGKIGWWKMLAVYMGIGVFQGAAEQLMMLGYSGDSPGSLGASGAIFGLMAIGLVWAPRNDVQCFLFMGLFSRTLEMTVSGLACLFLVIQVVTVFLIHAWNGWTTFVWGSELIHLSGAAIGFAVGIVLLKKKMVDCENWDIFSVRQGKHLLSRDELAQRNVDDPEFQRQERERMLRQQQALIAQFSQQITTLPVEAFATFTKLKHRCPDWKPQRREVLSLISELQKADAWDDSVNLMAKYVREYPENSTVVRLKLAEILMKKLKRPAQAQKVLSEVDQTKLEAKHQQSYDALWRQADKLKQEDPYEIVEDW